MYVAVKGGEQAILLVDGGDEVADLRVDAPQFGKAQHAAISGGGHDRYP